ncbi:MAG: hypothetical protein A2383_00500 [Candidatus Pacebacteria bacterium RIFOXYB1_FULL_39_46]|nr:MAG: hypothetical protein A2182_00330 [Candidatus Pacebacteria bacterium RIFOXYA1_FULL_38_18]OGJ38068.1 MAG: hypothetical protein A2383_00500 [Candidatus Pacebacteria bacterium RIFOXYB1_FULL_39_46]OGJ39709.1 MAG: hypothetical protein A2411_02945 [Candidatus Pacebacteria bacterium RIFOXYC1_FULL_39_21]OGJ39820.1 MAG: hypothetical protein A2582_00265 [Candidatus Pacebacteria bacterium RIFOXYD1_FULL_39_27]
MLDLLIAQNTGEGDLDLGSSYILQGGKPVSEVFSTPADLVNLIVPNLFVIAGVVIMVLIIVIGYKFIAQGEKGLQEAQKIASTMVAGLVIMFAAYWILQIIKVITGADIPL